MMRVPALAAVLCLLGSAPAFAELADGLEPYQLTRSLQLVQDRIADGDHAAMPMQRKLLDLLDQRLVTVTPHELSQRRNFSALLVYGMSGGNPTTFSIAAAKLDLKDTEKVLVTGIAAFLGGNIAAAHATLGSVDHRQFAGELGALLALVKGSVTPAADQAAAIALFDHARLNAPGSLVEEAALRRALPLVVATGDRQRFLDLSSAYVRRFLRSPYASQFAQDFVEGIATLFGGLDQKAVAGITDWMNTEQAQAIYLRLARRAAIEGDDALLDFTSSEAARLGSSETDPRSVLYTGIASVTSETVDDVLGALVSLDRARLSAADKALLDAARSVADAVVARPDPVGGTVEEEADDEPNEFVNAARARLDAVDKLLEDSAR
jgi:chemotaxis protein MotC